MISHRESFIHDMTPERIAEIIQNDAWKVNNQSITSSVTNDNNLENIDHEWGEVEENTSGINAFADIQFDNDAKRILDVGGGRYDNNRKYMKRERDIELLVWDPFNRSQMHNTPVRESIEVQKADAATSMSVLNVIPEVESRLAHITTLKVAVKAGGMAYFKIWPGDKPLIGTYLPLFTSNSYQANSYADRFIREIEIVFGIGNVKIHDSIKNLIVAKKINEYHTDLNEIIPIQNKSKEEVMILDKRKADSINKLYCNEKIKKIFLTRHSFFKKVENDFIERYRHQYPGIQHEYDKRFGLINAGGSNAIFRK